MSISRKNSEGYSDPTTYAALTNIEREERMARGGSPPCPPWRAVYICSPYRGDTERNIANARRYCRLAYNRGRIPIAPHLYLPQFLDDDDANERAAGLLLGIEALKLCSEVWVFGTVISDGMRGEIAEAKRRGLRIRYIER
jgi:hypothetical protein